MRTTKSFNKYLKLYGPHFTKKLVEFACKLMEKKNGPITPFTKEEVEEKLRQNKITLQYNKFSDAVFVANMCKADFLGSSVPNDDKHIWMYVKDVIDDPDGYDGQVFYRWLSDMEGMNIPIDWEEFV